MEKIDASKVFTEYREGVTPLSPLEQRKYTITHSDDTADLFVTIGREYAEDKVNELRDELYLTYEMTKDGLVLMGKVLLDGEGVEGRTELRNRIFAKELPIALQAVRIGDHKFFEEIPFLDTIPIYIWFQSELPAYNKLYPYGTMTEYKAE